MEISTETLMFLVLGEIKGVRNEIRKQNERIARLEQWQVRLKTACACSRRRLRLPLPRNLRKVTRTRKENKREELQMRKDRPVCHPEVREAASGNDGL